MDTSVSRGGPRTLSEYVRQCPQAQAILNSGKPSAQAAADISALGWPVSAPNIRQYRQRQRLSKDSLASPYPAGAKPPAYRPRGATTNWSTGFDIGPEDGEIRTAPRTVTPEYEPPADAELLAEAELDPAVWEVTAARKSRWQAQTPDGIEWMEAFRVSVRPRAASPERLTAAEVEAILEQYPRPQPAPPGDRILLVGMSDQQTGKMDNGGTPKLIETVARCTQGVADRISAEPGGRVASIVLVSAGDCIEGIVSQGGKLATRVDLSVTEMVRVYRRLLFHQLAVLAPLTDKLTYVGVPANHDESTRQFATKPSDSWGIDAASAVADALAMSDAYNHVSFVFPGDADMSVALNVGTRSTPLVLGVTHGHMASGPDAMEKFWSGQAMGRQPLGDADLLISGHWHHARLQQCGERTWCQLPALESGSDWWRNRTGTKAPAGLVSMWLHPGETVPWSGLTIHS